MIQLYAGLLSKPLFARVFQCYHADPSLQELGVGPLITSWGGGLGIALTQPAGTTTMNLWNLGA